MILIINFIIVRILLPCVLSAHNSIPFLEKVLSGIENVLTTFSISDKIIPKTDLLTGPLIVKITNCDINT